MVPPPTPARVYELTDSGRALRPALFELLRWGARYLLPSRPGDRFEPEWLQMVLEAYAAPIATPSISIAISVRDEAGDRRPVAIAGGGPKGTVIGPYASAEAEIAASPVALLGLMSARATLAEAEARGDAIAIGDREAAARFHLLFSIR